MNKDDLNEVFELESMLMQLGISLPLKHKQSFGAACLNIAFRMMIMSEMSDEDAMTVAAKAYKAEKELYEIMTAEEGEL